MEIHKQREKEKRNNVRRNNARVRQILIDAFKNGETK